MKEQRYTPDEKVAGRQQKIHAERDRKLEEARKTEPDSSVAGRVKNDKSISRNPLSRSCRRRVLRIRKHCGVTRELSFEGVHWRSQESTFTVETDQSFPVLPSH
jgi:hypothetical protein